MSWDIIMEVRKIKGLLDRVVVKLEHILKEGNMVADSLTNYICCFVGNQILTYKSLQELPIEATNIVEMDKFQVPNT